MSEPIKISFDELQSTKVDEALAAEAAYRGAWTAEGTSEGGAAVGKVKRQGATGRGRGAGVYYSGVVLTALMGLLGAILGWAMCEPWFDDKTSTLVHSLLYSIIVTLGAAALVACADGLLSRAWSRAGTQLLMGLAVGLGAGILGSLLAEGMYLVGSVVMVGTIYAMAPGQLSPTEPTFTMIVGNTMVRAMAWSLIGVAIGLAPGIHQRSRDLIMVGILGGVLGGFLGGLCFDLIGTFTQGGEVSRLVGSGFSGLVTGLAIGLVEQLSKDAWLFMEEGPLAGKQFVLYKDPTRIGSSPKNDVYLFKDSEISPEHALLRRAGSTHEVESLGDATVLVNGKRISRERLEDGDEVRIGKARFRYYVRAQRREVRS